jgi:hypothetical protein
MTDKNNVEIDDIRTKQDFKKISFSGFKKTDVMKKLQETIVSCKVDESLYWCFELVCSGHFLPLWETFFLVMSKNIHIGNPKLAIYMEMRSNQFKSIVNNGFVDQELLLRNNHSIKKMFCEIIFVLCHSQKKYEIHPIKIKEDDLSLKNINHLLNAPTVHYAADIFKDGDPKEIFIALNEFIYNISSDAYSSRNASYWFEWILLLFKVYQKKKIKISIAPRINTNIQPKFQDDIIWIIWEALMAQSKKKSALIERIIVSLYNIYCLRFTTGTKIKRKMLVYYAITIICDVYDHSIPLHSKSNQILEEKYLHGINKIYKEMKKHEKQTNTDYLFSNLKEGKSNIEKTHKKLTILDNIM